MLRRIFKTIGGGKKFVGLMLLRCPFDALWTLVIAEFLREAFNAILGGGRTQLYLSCLGFTLACLFVYAYNGMVWTLFASFATKAAAALRFKLFEKLTALSAVRIEEKPKGDYIARLNQDAQFDIITKPMQLPEAVLSLTGIIVSAIALFVCDARIFGLVLLFVLPHILVSRLIARPMTELSRRAREASGENTGDLDAFLSCAETAAAYDAGAFLMERFERSSLKLRRANMRMRRRGALGACILPIFGMGGYLVVLASAAGWIAAGELTFGDLTAAFQYRGGVLIGALTLINCIFSIRSSRAGLARVCELLETE